MKIAYYPGCSLEGSAREYDRSLKLVAERLGITLVEIPDWHCCGAASAEEVDPEMAEKLAGANLDKGLAVEAEEVLVPCAMCWQRLKNAARRSDHPLRVVSAVEFFARPEIREKIRAQSRREASPLLAAYYGCLLVRPGFPAGDMNPENPMRMEELFEFLGLPWTDFSSKTECCGSHLVLTNPDRASQLSGRILEKAAERNAEVVVTACPLCHANLDRAAWSGRGPSLPTLYLTELLGWYMGIEEVAEEMRRHLFSPDAFFIETTKEESFNG